MQLPTHLIAGILIQFALSVLIPAPEWLLILLIIGISFTSHFIIDAVSKFTYHPPQRVNDNFWLAWHLFIYAFGIFIIAIFFWNFVLGMFFANLVDIWDWHILRNVANRKNEPDWGKRFYLHPITDKIRSKFFFWIPNWNYNRLGIVPELILYLSWFIVIIFYLSGM